MNLRPTLKHAADVQKQNKWKKKKIQPTLWGEGIT